MADFEKPYTKTLIGENTNISGLCFFGYATKDSAKLPLIDHSHKDKLEFIILINGMLQYNASGVSYTLYNGDGFVTKPNEIHSGKKSLDPNNEILWFQIDLSEKENFLGLLQKEADYIHYQLSNFNKRQFKLSEEILQKLKESFRLLCYDDNANKIKGRLLFLYCLMDILGTKATVTPLSEEIDLAKQYIIKHIKESIDMDELLIKSGLSIHEFKEKFKQQIGVTPKEYINDIKIESAKKMIISSDVSIYDIAYEYHFSSANYFKKLFKQKTGYSPKEYRKKYKR